MKRQEDFVEDIYLGLQVVVMFILLNYGFPLFGKNADTGMQALSIAYVGFIIYRFYSVFGPTDKNFSISKWQSEVLSGVIEGVFLGAIVYSKLDSNWILSNVIFAYVLIQTIRFPRKEKYIYLLIGISLELLIYFTSPMERADLTELLYDVSFIVFIAISMSVVFKEIFSLQAENQYAVSQLKESNDKLGLMASTDYLTGLHNYKSFYQTINSFSTGYGLKASGFCMAIIDVDDFKLVNDTYGHPAGDEILAGVAQMIKDNIRHYDFAARYGGEEFAILFPEMTLEQAENTCERLREAIEERPFSIDGSIVRVTISIGVSRLGILSDEVVSRFIKSVDTLLYDAKTSGKNKVVSKVFCESLL